MENNVTSHPFLSVCTGSPTKDKTFFGVINELIIKEKRNKAICLLPIYNNCNNNNNKNNENNNNNNNK